MIKDVLKRQTTIIAVTVIALCIGLIGVSYAIFFDIKSSNEQSVTSGTLTVQFAETNNSFLTNFSNATGPVVVEPMDDEEGSTSDGYQFSVTNTGTLPMKYNIYLYDDPAVTTGTKLDKQYIKVMLDDGDITTLDKLTCTEKEAKDLGETSSSKISICRININELGVKAKSTDGNTDNVKSHTVRIWISSETPESEEGKIIALKLVVLGEVGEAKEPPKPKSFNEIIVANSTNIFADDQDENIRYAGADPNNYIWFNCNDYNAVTDATSAAAQKCEKWRIIGLMKNVDVVTGETTTQQDLVKIIRDEPLNKELSWDGTNYTETNTNLQSYNNDWSTSELMYLLNEGYDSHQAKTSSSGTEESSNNSLYWNSGKGKCYTGTTLTDCDFSTTGIKQEGSTKNMIEEVKWNLGGLSGTSSAESYYGTATTSKWYQYERGTETYCTTHTCSGYTRPTEWTGKIGLMYPSDYGYATSGGSKTRQTCLDTALSSWNSNSECYSNDWLYKAGTNQWELTPDSDTSLFVFSVISVGSVGYILASLPSAVRPSLYLKSNVKIAGEGGNGSAEQPYILTS